MLPEIEFYVRASLRLGSRGGENMPGGMLLYTQLSGRLDGIERKVRAGNPLDADERHLFVLALEEMPRGVFGRLPDRPAKPPAG